VTRIIILILFAISLISTGAEAEEISLNCKWDNGRVDDKTSTKGDPGTRDVIIKIDSSKKKVIRGVNTSQVDEIENTSFNDNYISWSEKSFRSTDLMTKTNKLQMSAKLVLNRSSGLLNETYIDHIYKSEIRNYYYCSRESKKF
jgi:hypothetical protein